METPNEIIQGEGQIYPATIRDLMPLVMADIGHIAKGNTNRDLKFAFRGIDDVYAALQPALIKHGVSLSTRIIDKEYVGVTSSKGTAGWMFIVHMAFRFTAPDGSFLEAESIGQSIDYSDKAAAQAMSIAMKMAVLQICSVPVAGEHDGDQHNPEAGDPNGDTPRATWKTEGRTPVANPESTNPNAISVGKLRRMYAIKTECGLTDEEAKAIVHAVGECESSKELDWRKYDAVIEAIQAKGAEKRGEGDPPNTQGEIEDDDQLPF